MPVDVTEGVYRTPAGTLLNALGTGVLVGIKPMRGMIYSEEGEEEYFSHMTPGMASPPSRRGTAKSDSSSRIL